jgi:hypothetical protein
MLIIHIVRSGSQYSVGKFHFKDIVALVVHLNLRDVTQKNILKAIEKLSRNGEYGCNSHIDDRCFIYVGLRQ